MNSDIPFSTVAVAVSGGADSLYSLIRLQERGLDVLALHGVFFQPRNDEEKERQSRLYEGLRDNCGKLAIPLTIVDLSQAFLELVISPFVHSYARGLTPNPCALCNARIKFGLLQDAAFGIGAQCLATGHYARLSGYDASDPFEPALFQGADGIKDQSYFLALTPRERLAKALFPLGLTQKSEVLRELAQRGVSIPQPVESQEVCFVPRDEYRDYLPGMAEQLGISLPGPGPMQLRDGRRIGTHKGLWRYTEGQRRGLGIGWQEPLHVLAKEQASNVLLLGPRHEMQVAGCVCDSANILLPPQFWPETIFVKTRYREKPKAARAMALPDDSGQGCALRIEFLDRENAVAPGQVAAIYIPGSGTPKESAPFRLVAGGVISRAIY